MLYSVMVMQITDISQFLPTAKESNHIPTIDFKLLQNYLPPFISAEICGSQALAHPTDFC